MSNVTTILAHNIRFLRKKAGLSQEELANNLKIKRSNIAAYEAKNVEPRLSVILEIAKFFNIDISHLLRGKLTDNQTFKSFKLKDDTPSEKQMQFNVEENPRVNVFIEKSIQMRKILTGFKAFYGFRKSKMENLSDGKEKLVYDIDNFIQLVEYLMNYNENVIAAITKQQPEIQ
jgi:transcriptional regulator with XRE-family HTH domain